MSTASAVPLAESHDHQPGLHPYETASEVLRPIADAHGLSIEQLIAAVCAAAPHVPTRKRTDVWKFPNDLALHAHLNNLRAKARAAGREFSLTGLDLRNIGGLNETLGQIPTDRVIDALLDLVIAAAKECCGGVDGADWQLIHLSGGDEYLLVLVGTNEYREIRLPNGKMVPCHDVTRYLDTMVRESVRFAIVKGLNGIPHPKRWWRMEWWGTGVVYAIIFDDPKTYHLDIVQMLDVVMKDVERRKKKLRPMHERHRGLREGEPNPLEISIPEQLWRLIRMPLVLFNKVFNLNLGPKPKFE